jgi:hypothetical protein
VVESFEEYLMSETLAISVSWEETGAADGVALSMGDKTCTARVEKVRS